MGIFTRGRRPGLPRGATLLLAGASLLVAQLAAAGPVGAYHGTYTVVASSGTMTPGTVDIGLTGDDAVRSLDLPFPVTIFGESHSAATVSTNGNLQFGTSDVDIPVQSVAQNTKPCSFAMWRTFSAVTSPAPPSRPCP